MALETLMAACIASEPEDANRTLSADGIICVIFLASLISLSCWP